MVPCTYSCTDCKILAYTFSLNKKLAIEANFNMFFTRKTLINTPWSTMRWTSGRPVLGYCPKCLMLQSEAAWTALQHWQPWGTHIGIYYVVEFLQFWVEEPGLVFVSDLSAFMVCLGRKTMENQFLLTIPGIVSLATCDFWLQNDRSHKKCFITTVSWKTVESSPPDENLSSQTTIKCVTHACTNNDSSSLRSAINPYL